MKEYLKSILHNEYGIENIKLSPLNRLWKITSPQGEYVVKTYKKNSIKQIEWIHFMLQELRKNGFGQFPKILKTKYRIPYVFFNDNILLVTEYLNGNQANYSNFDDIDKVIKILAAFHHSAAYINRNITPRYVEPIDKKLEERVIKFTRLYQQIKYSKTEAVLEQRILMLGKDMISFSLVPVT